MSDEDNSVVVGEANSLQEANEYRSRMLRGRPKLWLFVMKDVTRDVYEISAANQWCGKLPEDEIKELIEIYKQTNKRLWDEYNAKHGVPSANDSPGAHNTYAAETIASASADDVRAT